MSSNTKITPQLLSFVEKKESITGNSAHRSEPMRGEYKNKDAALRTLPMRGMEHVKDSDAAASESTLKRGTFDFTILTTTTRII